MDYIELTLDAADAEQAKILTAELADFPFESFEQEGARLKAYIPQERLADCKGEVDALLARYGVGRATFLSIEPQNWNALWESNFTPVEVDGRPRSTLPPPRRRRWSSCPKCRSARATTPRPA